MKEEQFPSKDDLPKTKLYIRMDPETSRDKRNVFKNDLLNYIKDDKVFLFDSASFSDDIEARMIILHILN